MAAATLGTGSTLAAAHTGIGRDRRARRRPGHRQAPTDARLRGLTDGGGLHPGTCRWRHRWSRGRLDRPRRLAGDGGTTVLRWTGGSLPSDEAGEFPATFQVPDTPGVLLTFPSVQRCENGEELAWISGDPESEFPAPRLLILAAGSEPASELDDIPADAPGRNLLTEVVDVDNPVGGAHHHGRPGDTRDHRDPDDGRGDRRGVGGCLRRRRIERAVARGSARPWSPPGSPERRSSPFAGGVGPPAERPAGQKSPSSGAERAGLC